jgi:NADPH:quinone reductase-like Zn-dependent oxidoreductase
MHAAVVRSFEHPPRYEEFDLPPTDDESAVVVNVLAAALHPRVRSGASGSHYADEHLLPMIPGIDAVGLLPDGKKVYCVVHDTPFGTMAEKVVADRRRCVPLPDDVGDAQIAAGMNPATSSWLALRLRAPILPGQSVFILGATGNAGQMAIQVAKRLGAGKVVAAGRQVERLDGSGADQVVSLRGEPASVGKAIADAASEADIVLDYLWGEPAAHAMMSLLAARPDRSRALNWIQIGAVAGATIALPSVTLRSANLRIMGSGQGSVSTQDIVGELTHLVDELVSGTLAISAKAVPLSCVEAVWDAPASDGTRVVFVP